MIFEAPNQITLRKRNSPGTSGWGEFDQLSGLSIRTNAFLDFSAHQPFTAWEFQPTLPAGLSYWFPSPQSHKADTCNEWIYNSYSFRPINCLRLPLAWPEVSKLFWKNYEIPTPHPQFFLQGSCVLASECKLFCLGRIKCPFTHLQLYSEHTNIKAQSAWVCFVVAVVCCFAVIVCFFF